MKDWSSDIVKLQPLSRRLEESLNRREFTEAEVVAQELLDVVHSVYRYVITQSVKRGSYYG